MSEWMIQTQTVAGREFYQVCRVDGSTGDTITRGGYYETEREALKLISKLNEEADKNAVTV